MNSKFPVLSTISKLLKFIGFSIILAVIYFIFPMLYTITEKGVGVAFVVIVLGLIIVAIGESIGVLFAIEENTRKNK